MFVEDIHAPQHTVKQFANVSLVDFGLESFALENGENSYFRALQEAAWGMISPNFDYTQLLRRYGCEFKEKMNGMSRVHPFLEIGGAIRIQVPIPQNMEELRILLKVVFQRYEGPEFDAFLDRGFTSFSPKDSLKIDLEGRRLFVRLE